MWEEKNWIACTGKRTKTLRRETPSPSLFKLTIHITEVAIGIEATSAQSEQCIKQATDETPDVTNKAQQAPDVVVENAAEPVAEAVKPENIQRDVQAREHGQEVVGSLLLILMLDAVERVEPVIFTELVLRVYKF